MPSAISQAILARQEAGSRGLVLFVTAGDPSLEELPAILETLAEAGADVIEVGLPFSDPIADGPVIQASSQRALDRGVKTRAVIETLAAKPLPVPVVVMGYLNPVLRWGLREFAQDAVSAGVSGTIMCDLTVDEAEDWIAASRGASLDTIFLAAPTSTASRLDQVARASTGFVYAVSRTGVTGVSDSQQASPSELVAGLKARTDVPVALGFGIGSPAAARTAGDVADAVIVGSWLVRLLADQWDHGKGAGEVKRQVAEFRAAIDSLA